MCPPPDAATRLSSQQEISVPIAFIACKCRAELALGSSEGMAFWGYSHRKWLCHAQCFGLNDLSCQ